MNDGPVRARKTNGLIQVYTGTGKGKTTASLGLVFRALGHNFNVCMVQFLKGGTYLGEYESAKKFRNFKLLQFGVDCPWADQLKAGTLICGSCRYCFNILKDDVKQAEAALKASEEALTSGAYDIVVLDEINCVMNQGLVNTEDVIKLLKKKNRSTEVILTGRSAPKEIIDIADLVTEMKLVKHPMLKGIQSRLGIEY